MLVNITNSAGHLSCESKLLIWSIFIWLCLIVTAYPNRHVQSERHVQSTFDEKSTDDDLQELHLISDFNLLQHDTVIMRSRREIKINQPFDTYISVSFLANGTKHYYDLELDCSAYSETASFDFYEHSDDEESNMKLRTSLSPTCNHYIAIMEEKWISLKLYDPENFRATIASQEGFFLVEPVKYMEKQKIESIRRRGISDSEMVYSKIQAPLFHPPLARNGNLNGNSTHQRQYCGTPDTVSTNYGSSDKRRAIHKWYGCYDRENENLMLPMLILVDRAYSKEFFSEAEVKESISNIIETTNAMFQAQFNMVIGIGATKIMMTVGGPSWNKDRGDKARTCGWPNTDQFFKYSKGTKRDINAALDAVVTWNKSQPEVYGLVHLLSNCFGMQDKPNNNGCSGTTGLANKKVLCKTEINVGISNMGSTCGARIEPSKTWMTFAHEVGHNFGAEHTLDVGGIMDYSDGKYDGTVQFHPNNKVEVCTEIQRALTSSPKCFADRRPNPHKSEYHWRPVKGHCEGICDLGTIKTTYVCYGDKADSPAHSINCIEKHKPPSKESNCKLPACTNNFVWTLGPGEDCIGTCGFGTKFASYYCYDTIKHAPAIGGDVACQNMGAKPDPKETPCYTGKSCYKWVSEIWGLCSEICDGGTQVKEVHCETNNGIKVENDKCILEGGTQLDEERRPCNTRPCPGKSLEQQCIMKNYIFSGKCLYLMEMKECDALWCSSGGSFCYQRGKIRENTLCSNEKGYCKSGVCEIYNEPLWTVGPWSHCKKSTCAVALQNRTVTCQMWPSEQVVEDNKCDIHDRPINGRSCSCVFMDPNYNGGGDGGSESSSKSVVIGIIAATVIIVVVIVGVVGARRKGYIRFSTFSTKNRQSEERREYSSKGNASSSVIKEVTPDYRVNYAMVESKSTVDKSNSVHGGMTHKALYDYEAKQNDEIGFRAGEKMVVIEKMDDGWYKCRTASGHLGLAPGTYLEIMPPRNANNYSRGPVKKAAPPIPGNRPPRPPLPNSHPERPPIALRPKTNDRWMTSSNPI